ncbi:MAG: CARDB domain-containing protein, partial [Saprospiraceae bacterium]
DYVNFYHNNIRNGSSNASSKAFYSTYGSNLNFVNNIAVHEGTGYAMYATGTSSYASSDYNDLFSAGMNVGYWNNTGQLNLSDWQATSSLDANSISIDPSFTAADDLHVSQIALDSAATLLASITDDIDGEARSATHPDIGADEFGAAVTDDIGISAVTAPVDGCDLSDNEAITVSVTNFGGNVATGFDVTVIVDNATTITENVGAFAVNAGTTQSYTFVATFDLTATGTHTIKAYTTLLGDANTVNDTINSSVEHHANPNITFSPASPTVCAGESRSISAFGGSTYQWNVASSGNSINVSPITNTTYYVTVTNSNGCISNDSIELIVNPLPVANATNGGAYCDGQDIQLTATGGIGYVWSGPNGFTSGMSNPVIPNAVALNTGSYYVTVTDVNGCSDSASTFVSVGVCTEICNNGIDDDNDGKVDCDDTDCHAAIGLVASGATTICLGDSVTLTASNGSAYLWSTGATADNIRVGSAGTYSVIITSGSGCDSTMSMVINMNAQPTATASNTGAYCIGEDIELNAGGGVFYAWSGPNSFVSSDQNPTISNSIAANFGTYTVIVTNNNGCRDTATTTVTNNGNNAPTLAYSGNANFVNEVVSPTSGDAYTTFRFEVTYTDADGHLPASGEPQVWMDAENNGNYFNTNDRVLFMQELDPTDSIVTDGKRYYFETIGLPISGDWNTEIRTSDGNGCNAVFGGFDAPDVLNATDVSIFANDITFSDANPNTGDTITVSTIIHNYSNFDATNFIVKLLNQNDSLSQNDTVSIVPALGNITLEWEWIVSDTPSWNPMQVILDLNNTINEPNELDNTALRPFTVGNFVIGGDIITTLNASPNPSYPNRTIRVSGNAVYTDLAVTLADSSVAGATVTFSVYDSIGAKVAGPFSTYTNSLGSFSKSFYQSLPAPATYTVRGNTTDFTLTDTFETNFDLITPVIICEPDLQVNIALSDYKITVGTTITGTATVYNYGCDTADASQLFIELPDGTPVPGPYSVPQLLPNQSHTVDLGNMTFNTIGQTYIKAYADYTNLVFESNEFNNTRTRSITVLPALPDLVAKSYSIGTLYDCDTACFSFYIGNDGGVGAGRFDVVMDVFKNGVFDGQRTNYIDTLASCKNTWTSFCYLFSDATATYTVSVYADSSKAITEYKEDNNGLSFNRSSAACEADLVVVECGSLTGIDANPVDVSFPQNMDLFAEIRNQGNQDATNFDVRFLLINTSIPDTTVYTVNYPGTLAGGQRDTVSLYGIPNIALGDQDLVIVIDPTDVVNERNENNNTEEVNLCYEFNLSRYCYTSMWWDRTHTVFNPFQMGVRVKNDGIFDASSTDVKFEVSGPGITGWQLIGQGTQAPASTTTCNCNYAYVLPTPYAFQQAGTYQVRMTVDPDNAYTECDESNNVLIVSVDVVQVPDMRVLSQYINPNLLNPEVGQDVTFDVTYENLGVSNVGDSMELFIMVDEIPLDSMKVGGLSTGDFNTVNFTTPWSSTLVGAHVARVIIDNDEEINESNELNNEATRALHVGQLPDLYPTNFCVTAANPALYSAALLEARIHNGGDTSCNADVYFYYVDANLDTILIGSTNIDVDALDSLDITYPWNNVYSPTTLILKIVNADPEEARTDNNEAFCTIGALLLIVEKDFDATCENDGQATATITGGTAPYTYAWSNGHNSHILTAPAGVYTLTVTDDNGLTATGQVVIDQTGSLNAFYSVSDTCSPTNLFLSADKGASSYYWTGPNGFTGYDSDTTVNGADTTYSGIYTVTATYANGCEEVTTVSVNIGFCCTIDTVYTNQTTCILDSEGTFQSTLTGSDGCDSIVFVTYTYLAPDTTYLNSTTCQIDGGGVFTSTLSNINGCDSVIISTVTYASSSRDTNTLTICQGDSVIVGANIYKTTGIFIDSFTTVIGGCDSIITTNLTVAPAIVNNQNQSICFGDSLIIGTNAYKTTGIYTDTLVAMNDCDSVVITNLTVHPNAVYNDDVTICNGDSLWIGDSFYTSTGTQVKTLQTVNGCDSVVTINLTVSPAITSNSDVGICEGDSISINGSYILGADTYIYNLTATNGCDSTATINLYYFEKDTTYLTAQTCNPAQVGQVSNLLQNGNGCDSLIITTYNLVATVRDTINATICESDSFVVNNVAYYNEGNYMDTLTASGGCDSIITLNLNVVTPDTIYLNTTTCDAGLAGQSTVSYTNMNGCDSTVITTIT